MKRIVNGIVLLLMLAQMSAQEVMTLEKALAIGLENNFGVQIAEKNIQVAENNNSWARVGRYPTIDLNGTFRNSVIKDNLSFFLRDPYYSGGLGGSVDANWLVYNGGRVRIAKQQLEQGVGVEQLNKDSQVHDLIRDVIQAYYAVLVQQEREQVLEESMALSQDRLRYEETKKEFGASNSFNLIQFRNAIINDSINIVSQDLSIAVAQQNLYRVINLIGVNDYAFAERLTLQAEEIDQAKLEAALSEENYTLRSLVMLADINTLNTKLEEVGRKPTVSLNGSLGATQSMLQIFGDNPNTGERYDFNTGSTVNGSINAVASWNLYDGGVTKANIQNAKIQEEIGQLNILEAKAQLKNQLGILISNYESQLTLLDMAENQRQVAQQNITLTEERFKAGQITSLDFQNIQNQYLNAAFNKVNAMYNLIITKSEIDYLVGKFN